MNSKECLNKILDMLNYEQTNECEKNSYLKIIRQDLDKLEKLENENQKLKLINKQLFENNDFMNNQNRMLENVVKLFKRNLYASILDNNMSKNKTEELLQLLDKVLGGISIIYE